MVGRKSSTGWIKQEITSLKKQKLFNEIKSVKTGLNGKIKINGKKVINFSSNNYLGLANDKRLRTAAKKAIDKYGVGPGAVRTIAGTFELHKKLEKELARFKKAESVITFQSGFMANFATIPALVGEGDVIVSDELNHASIIDGCRISKAEIVRYKHVDTRDLEVRLKSAIRRGRRVLVVTDGVFSMDGDIAPLDAIYKVASRYGAMLMVDDAHGEGVLGKNGRGIVDHFGLHGKVDIEVGTMSKAFGVVGGFVAAKREVTEWLSQRGRPFLFSSAMSLPDVAACLEAVKILSRSDALVKKLWENTDYFKKEMRVLGFDIGNSATPIIPVMLGEASLAQEFSKKLYNNGVFAKAIVYPTVPVGRARIRVMNTASHKKRDVDEALKIFEKVGRGLKVI